MEPITLCIGNLHEEDIKLLVLEEANTDIILGRPWFVLHEPQISWRTGDVLKWGDQCFPDCFPNLPRPSMPVSQTLSLNSTSIESPIEKQFVEIPECYAHFSDVFCPTKASQLPPHRPWDCAIDLLPGESVPKGKIYPLSLPEQKAMEEYIEEALQQGYIRPSTSPAASSFFFVAKKDGCLRPCIDYRALNNITVKFRYPLPLVPAALEHLRGATTFTKLDLRSAYNLIRIGEGDEWKTVFVTPTGHYEYLVMPYGLVNDPPYSRISCMRCSESTSIASFWFTSMTSWSTLGGWPNIVTTLRRSFNVYVNINSLKRQRSVLSTNPPYSS